MFHKRGNISSIFNWNSEAFASEFLVNIEEKLMCDPSPKDACVCVDNQVVIYETVNWLLHTVIEN